MEIFLQILAYTIPSVVTAIVIYLLINKMLKVENQRRNYEVRKDTIKQMTPIRLRAYERMAIFLERINPDSLLMRQTLRDTSAAQLQTVLLQQIRQEWEHNVTQQLYITNDTWTLLINVKESMVQLVNTCAAQMPPKTMAIEYATLILNTYKSVDRTPIEIALTALKNDISRM